jgi:hypothetical protein
MNNEKRIRKKQKGKLRRVWYFQNSGKNYKTFKLSGIEALREINEQIKTWDFGYLKKHGKFMRTASITVWLADFMNSKGWQWVEECQFKVNDKKIRVDFAVLCNPPLLIEIDTTEKVESKWKLAMASRRGFQTLHIFHFPEPRIWTYDEHYHGPRWSVGIDVDEKLKRTAPQVNDGKNLLETLQDEAIKEEKYKSSEYINEVASRDDGPDLQDSDFCLEYL